MVPQWSRRAARRSILAILAAFVLLGSTASPAPAALGLPDIDVAMVIEVHDGVSWLALYEEVLGTPHEAAKPLYIGIAGSTGGARWLTVMQAQFTTQLYVAQGVSTLKVVISGKIPGQDALRGLAPFELAVLEMQAGAVDNSVVLSYGLAASTAQLLELHLSRP